MKLQEVPGHISLPANSLENPRNVQVLEILPKLAPDSSLTQRLEGGRELEALAETWHNPRTIRGSDRMAAERGIDKSLLDEIYRIFESAPKALQLYLLPVISAVGDGDFLDVVDKMVLSGIDDQVYSSCIYTLGRIGGRKTVEWLAVRALLEVGSKRDAINLTIQELCFRN